MGEWLGSQPAGLGVVAEPALLFHERQPVGWSHKISCVPKQAEAISEVHEPGNEFRSTLLA